MEKRLEFIEKLNDYLDVASESYEKQRVLYLNNFEQGAEYGDLYEEVYNLAYESGYLDATKWNLDRIKGLVNEYIFELTRKSLNGELDE